MTTMLVRPTDVAVVEGTDEEGLVSRAYVARLPRGPVVVLSDTAGVIWSESINGDRAGVTDRVAARLGLPPDDVRADVEKFVAQLIGQGLLRSSDA